MASSHGYFLLLILLLLPYSLFAQNRSQINVGSSLTAGDDSEQPWISPSGDFAFGFQQLEKKDLYLLAIWYNKIPDKTIVWYANGDNLAPRSSKVELTSDRGLVLTGPQGVEIWRSEISVGEAAYGLLNDTGNFIVKDTADESESLWQSFEDPRDTLLPGMTLDRDGSRRRLISRLRESNFYRGSFQFRVNPAGNGAMIFNNYPSGFPIDDTYYSTSLSTPGLRIEFNESGYLYVLTESNGREPFFTPGKVVSAAGYYHRVILHFDGVLAQYAYPKNSTKSNEKWQSIFNEPTNICNTSGNRYGSGPCGFNSICKLSDDQRATCVCPQQFSRLDPNDEYGDCKPDYLTQFCEDDENNSSDDFDFIELTSIDWPSSSYEGYNPSSVEDCKKSCREDCFCDVIAVTDGKDCWKKTLPLTNGNEKPDVRSFIKVRKGGNVTSSGLPPFSFPSKKKNQDSLVLLVSLLLGGSVFINFILFGLFGFSFCIFYSKKTTTAQLGNSNLLHFGYMELVEATNGFKEELGRGSFGIVYKGKIDSTIAVKKLDRAVAESEKEFQTEVEVIGQTQHKNLVKLLGFCDEGKHRLLEYELMSNRSLSNFLFGGKKLSWEERTRISLGIVKGLVYLHEECTTQIIHCDIKPQNIILDENYDAKIADFVLAKLLMIDQSRTFTAIRGTKGYVAPEWFRNLPVTPKVDVYSFGVLLLEIVCCRRNVDSKLSGEDAILTDWAYDCFADGKLDVLIEKDDEEAMDDLNKVKRFLMVGIWCIQEANYEDGSVNA